MERLQPGQWLSDSVIKAYLSLLTKCDEKLHEIPTDRTQFLYGSTASLHFLEKETIDAQAKQLILVFHVTNNHFTTVLVDYTSKTIMFCDSYHDLGYDSKQLLDYLLNLIFQKRQNEANYVWTKEYDTPVPQQNNGNDCGIFALMCAEAAWLHLDLQKTYGQKNAVDFRHKIAVSLLRGKIKTSEDEPFQIQIGESSQAIRQRRREANRNNPRSPIGPVIDVSKDSTTDSTKEKQQRSEFLEFLKSDLFDMSPNSSSRNKTSKNHVIDMDYLEFLASDLISSYATSKQTKRSRSSKSSKSRKNYIIDFNKLTSRLSASGNKGIHLSKNNKNHNRRPVCIMATSGTRSDKEQLYTCLTSGKRTRKKTAKNKP